jgi:hypothetical protein
MRQRDNRSKDIHRLRPRYFHPQNHLPAATPGHVVPSVEDITDEAFTILTAAAVYHRPRHGHPDLLRRIQSLHLPHPFR